MCPWRWQDPSHALFGQKGKYTEEFRKKNFDKHLSGNYPPETDKPSVAAMVRLEP